MTTNTADLSTISSRVDFVSLNTIYLRTLRDVATRSLAEAVVRFGVTQDVAEAVVVMPIHELERLAQVNEVIFRSSLTITDIRAMLNADEGIRTLIGGLANARLDLPNRGHS